MIFALLGGCFLVSLASTVLLLSFRIRARLLADLARQGIPETLPIDRATKAIIFGWVMAGVVGAALVAWYMIAKL